MCDSFCCAIFARTTDAIVGAFCVASFARIKCAVLGAFFVASSECTKGLILYALGLRAELELGLRARLRLEFIALSYFLNTISFNNISGGPGVTLETSRRLVYLIYNLFISV
jgi:hypothetical protein